MSWYKSGYEAIKQEEDSRASMGGPYRFWLPADSTKDLIFVDSSPFCISEHNPKVNGSFDNHTTCLQGIDQDTACCDLLDVKSRYFVGYYTVIDCSKYTDKKGVTHQYELKLFPAKLRTLKKIRRKEEGGTLMGSMIRAVRDDPKSPNVGEEFETLKKVDLAAVFPHVTYKGKKLVDIWAKAADQESIERLQKVFSLKLVNGKPAAEIPAFNYMDLLKPMAAKDIRQKFTGAIVEAGFADDAAPKKAAEADETVPF